MKTFLSIGTGFGIGLATAERFARGGFRIVLTARERTQLMERAARLRDLGYTVETATADAGDLASIEKVVADTEAQFQAIDAIHFNSASMHQNTIETQDISKFATDLTINIGAALVAIREGSRGMLARREGTLLITGGVLGVTPNPQFLSLSIGKAGARALALGLFDTFRERSVHIATVTVGTMVAAGSVESRDVAEAFWALHVEPKDAWRVEAVYPA